MKNFSKIIAACLVLGFTAGTAIGQDRLRLTLTFEDYAGTEKVSRLTPKLDTTGAPSGFDPSTGDLAYYAPWGNLCVFYRDFSYSGGLVSMGRIESGVEKLAAIRGDFTVTLEKAE